MDPTACVNKSRSDGPLTVLRILAVDNECSAASRRVAEAYTDQIMFQMLQLELVLNMHNPHLDYEGPKLLRVCCESTKARLFN